MFSLNLCDVDEQFFAQKVKTVQDRTGLKPLTEWDIRKVLDDKKFMQFLSPHRISGMLWVQSGHFRQVNMSISRNLRHTTFSKVEK